MLLVCERLNVANFVSSVTAFNLRAEGNQKQKNKPVKPDQWAFGRWVEIKFSPVCLWVLLCLQFNLKVKWAKN